MENEERFRKSQIDFKIQKSIKKYKKTVPIEQSFLLLHKQ